MQKKYLWIVAITIVATFSAGCNSATENKESTSVAGTEPAKKTGQSGVQDSESQKDVVKIAVGSPDHTTLVKALQAAEYVDALSNAGPFTVFAPTNAAFDKLPKGILEDLLKPEKRNDLRSILEYHVYVGVLKPDFLQDGQTYGTVNGANISIGVKDGKITINGKVNVIASVPASNGIIHIIDEVLLPPAK
ncbi:MAG TPA: fasciclin domain-containing protein [Chitinophagaceae bacterium]|nr:fasciclin domain-containing protein [Chitinophagaceae bacterium]